MLLLRILHGIESLHIFLRLFINIMQLLISHESSLGGHLENYGDLGIGEDLNVGIEFGAEAQFGRVFYSGYGLFGGGCFGGVGGG